MSDGKMVMEEYKLSIDKEELSPGVVVYKNVIPGHTQILSYINDSVNSNVVSWEERFQDGGSYNFIPLDYPRRFVDYNDPEIPFHDKLPLMLSSFLGFAEMDYVKGYSLPHTTHENFLVLRFDAENSFYAEIKKNDMHEKPIRVLYYLNDEYDGGSVNFTDLGITYVPKANEAIIFPSSEGFDYTVEKITSGSKYAVVTHILMSVPKTSDNHSNV